MKIMFIIILLSLTKIVVADIYLNEINYNPEGSDDNKEFIELFLTTPQDLSNYKIKDLSSEANLTLLQYRETSFALIVEEGFNFTSLNASIYSVRGRIGSGLNNDRDLILMKDENGTILESIMYFADWGADGNGNTLCKLPDKMGRWQECASTPGLSNTETTQDLTHLSINEFLVDPFGDDEAEKPAGEWIELYNGGNISLNVEGFVLYDEHY